MRSLYNASVIFLVQEFFHDVFTCFNNIKMGENRKYGSPNATPIKKERKLINTEEKLDIIILPEKGEVISYVQCSWLDHKVSKYN
jgi:hypothetical protein